MRSVNDMAADRGPYVCQTQSMNLFVAEPTFKKLSTMHFYAWKRGLKTGVYYLRSKPAARAVQVTVTPPADGRQGSAGLDPAAADACRMCSA